MTEFKVIKNVNVLNISEEEDEAGFVSLDTDIGIIRAKPMYLKRFNITEPCQRDLVIFISKSNRICLAYNQEVDSETLKESDKLWMFQCHANVKPISVNRAWYMNKKKSKDYMKFQEDMLDYLSGHIAPQRVRDNQTKLECELEFGFSSVKSDVDNCIKTTLDTLQSFFGFDDRIIFKVTAQKFKVNKTEDYLKIKLYEIS